ILRDLSGDRPDRSRGSRHHDGLAWPDVCHVHADVGREPGVPEDTEVHGQGRTERIREREEACLGPCDAVLLPLRVAANEHPGADVLAARLDHLSDADAPHHLTELDWRRVLAHVAHPQAIRRVEREIERADEDLAVRELENPFTHQFEIALRGDSHRPFAETIGAVCQGGRAHVPPSKLDYVTRKTRYSTTGPGCSLP